MLNRIGFNNFSQKQRNTLSFGISKEKLNKVLDKHPELIIQIHRSADSFVGTLKYPVEKGTRLVTVDAEDKGGMKLQAAGYGATLEQVYEGIASRLDKGDKLSVRGKHICTVA